MSVLHTSVLVLNQNYEPLNVCNARRAVVLLDRGKAEIVENGERIIHTVMRAVSIPSVIRMVYFVKRPRPVARLSRREIFARDGYRCQYCGHATRDLTLDHVQPRSRGGNHSWENLTSACKTCNHRKAGRTPAEARMQPANRSQAAARPSLYSVFARHLVGHRTWRMFFPGAPHDRRGRSPRPASPPRATSSADTTGRMTLSVWLGLTSEIVAPHCGHGSPPLRWTRRKSRGLRSNCASISLRTIGIAHVSTSCKRAVQLLSSRRVQILDRRERVNPRDEQDLVRVGIPNTANELRIHQHVFHLTPIATQSLQEHRFASVPRIQRVRPHLALIAAPRPSSVAHRPNTPSP